MFKLSEAVCGHNLPDASTEQQAHVLFAELHERIIQEGVHIGYTIVCAVLEIREGRCPFLQGASPPLPPIFGPLPRQSLTGVTQPDSIAPEVSTLLFLVRFLGKYCFRGFCKCGDRLYNPTKKTDLRDARPPPPQPYYNV